MLSSISWQQYCTVLIVATSLYYLFIWIAFYGMKLSFLSRVGKMQVPSFHAEDQPDEVITTAQHVIDELRPLFAERSNKNELILSLQLSLKKYNQWEEPGFQDTINEFIIREGQSKCSIYLSEEDLRVCWK